MQNNPFINLIIIAAIGFIAFCLYIERKTKEHNRKIDDAIAEGLSLDTFPKGFQQKLNFVQMMCAFPYFGTWIATGLGLLPPILVFMILPESIQKCTLWFALINVLVIIWALCISILFKIKITVPVLIFRIPLVLVASLLVIADFFMVFTDK